MTTSNPMLESTSDLRTFAAQIVKLALVGLVFLIGGKVAAFLIGDHPLRSL